MARLGWLGSMLTGNQWNIMATSLGQVGLASSSVSGSTSSQQRLRRSISAEVASARFATRPKSCHEARTAIRVSGRRLLDRDRHWGILVSRALLPIVKAAQATITPDWTERLWWRGLLLKHQLYYPPLETALERRSPNQ